MIGKNDQASVGYCVEDGTATLNLPSFFNRGWQSATEADPEPVTLNAGQTLPAAGTYSSSTNAAATGDETGAAYAQSSTQGGGVFRWPSSETYAASTTELAVQKAARTLGVPCFTTDQTGSGTNKYIQKGMLVNKYLCK